MSAAIQAACDAAMHRIRKGVNAAAGQHKRAVRKGFAEALREYGVEAIDHPGAVGEFVGEAEALQSADATHEVAHANGLDSAVDRAGLVPDADAHAVAASVGELAGLKGGDDGRVIGAGGVAVGDGVHVPPGLEKYAEKYRAKGIVSEGTNTARRIIGAGTLCAGSGCNAPEGECLGFCTGAAR